VRYVDRSGTVRHLRPELAGAAVFLQCALERYAASRALVERVEHAAAQLGGEKSAESCLDLHIHGHPAQLSSAFNVAASGLRARFDVAATGLRTAFEGAVSGQRDVTRCRRREVVQPLRDLDGRVAAG